MDITFKVPQIPNSIIMVAGVGGGGGSAVKHMYSLGNAEVSFAVINTDKQALDRSPIPTKILLGNGLGAGNKPEVARAAAEAGEEAIREALVTNDTKMLFITAGMGGGTGTGASPIVARIAKELGILTVGIVSIPYKGEGPKRVRQAVVGIEELIANVDSLIVINNEHIAQIHGKLGISEAHAKADDILAMAAKSIADIITSHMEVNVDFADVTTIMRDDSGDPRLGKIALMGSATGSADGEDSAMRIAQEAVNSPLLHHNDIRGAKKVLLNITWGETQVSYDEALKVMDFIQKRADLAGDDQASNQTDLIWGAGYDASLGNNIRITVVATGFDMENIPAIRDYYSPVLDRRSGKAIAATPKREGPVIISLDEPEVVPVAKKQVDSVVDDWEVKDYGQAGGDRYESARTVSWQRSAAADEPTVYQRERQVEVEHSRGGYRAPVAEPVVAPAAPVSTPVSMPAAVKTPVSSVIDDNLSTSAMDDRDESFTESPAYLRRGVSLYTPSRGSSTQRESLGSDAPSASNVEQSTISLFDD